MQEEDFARVLAAAQTGAGWAFERLYRSLAPAVGGYLRVQGAPDTDDQVSEVFLGVFRGIAQFTGDERQFRSWVFTIAHRRLVDGRRQAARRPLPTTLAPDDNVFGGDVEADAFHAIGTERVRMLCETLVPDQRDVLLLRLVGGLTVDEVAKTLGKSRGATKALQRRGLIAVRRQLASEGVPL